MLHPSVLREAHNACNPCSAPYLSCSPATTNDTDCKSEKENLLSVIAGWSDRGRVLRRAKSPFSFSDMRKIRCSRKSGKVIKKNFIVFGVQMYNPHNRAVCRTFRRCTVAYKTSTLYAVVHSLYAICTRYYRS